MSRIVKVLDQPPYIVSGDLDFDMYMDSPRGPRPIIHQRPFRPIESMTEALELATAEKRPEERKIILIIRGPRITVPQNIYRRILLRNDAGTIVIKCRDQNELLAHREVLAATSETFESLIEPNRNQRSIEICLIRVHHLVLRLLLRFLYDNYIEVPETLLVEFNRLVERFKIRAMNRVTIFSKNDWYGREVETIDFSQDFVTEPISVYDFDRSLVEENENKSKSNLIDKNERIKERIKKLGREREKERGNKLERSREKQRGNKLERSREKQRGSKPDRSKEKERGNKPERGGEKGRGNKLERSREKERGSKPDRSREKERGNKPERSREKERGNKPEISKEKERGNKPERGGEKGRGNKLERSKEKERGSKPDRSREKERGNKPERSREKERGNKPEISKEKERGSKPDRSREKERGNKPERGREKERGSKPERSREKERRTNRKRDWFENEGNRLEKGFLFSDEQSSDSSDSSHSSGTKKLIKAFETLRLRREELKETLKKVKDRIKIIKQSGSVKIVEIEEKKPESDEQLPLNADRQRLVDAVEQVKKRCMNDIEAAEKYFVPHRKLKNIKKSSTKNRNFFRNK
ncbi:hypothetical protein TKK_0016299 [Trichogramma kaykai]|uniref:BTB domain-containing protein n=1 Tax=Trichogramma kaykai TaxID=54128 RepID=A0ABD2W848_9HYME